MRPEAAHTALPPLPLPCVLDFLSRLEPGERLLCLAVSRAWRAAVCSLWRSIDLTPEVCCLTPLPTRCWRPSSKKQLGR